MPCVDACWYLHLPHVLQGEAGSTQVHAPGSRRQGRAAGSGALDSGCPTPNNGPASSILLPPPGWRCAVLYAQTTASEASTCIYSAAG